MRQSLIFASLFFLLTLGHAQHAYQLFQPGVQYLYEHQLPLSVFNSPLLGIQVGEEACQVMYESLQPNIPGGDTSCIVRVPSFIGSEVCQTVEETSLNLGSDEDPLWLTLYPQSAVGNTWLAATNSMGPIYAKVDDLAWVNVLGVMDSVKSIGLYLENENEDLIPLYQGEAPLQVSRNHGLVKAVFLHWLGIPTGSIDLVGLDNPVLGIQNPNRESVFQLQIGDVLHLTTVETTLTGNSFYHEYREKKNTITATGWFNGVTERYYAFMGEQKVYQSGPDASMDTLWLANEPDTLVLPWTPLAHLNEQPGAIIASDFNADTWHTISLGHKYICEQPAKRLGAPVLLADETCALPLLDALPGEDFYTFYGGPYYQFVTLGGFRHRILRYAQVGEEPPCGTPFDFVVGTTSITDDLPVQLWPNPAQGAVQLSWPASFTSQLDVELWNANGQLLRTYNKLHSGQTIQITDLPAGLYYLRYISPTGNLQTQKIIKH